MMGMHFVGHFSDGSKPQIMRCMICQVNLSFIIQEQKKGEELQHSFKKMA